MGWREERGRCGEGEGEVGGGMEVWGGEEGWRCGGVEVWGEGEGWRCGEGGRCGERGRDGGLGREGEREMSSLCDQISLEMGETS